MHLWLSSVPLNSSMSITSWQKSLQQGFWLTLLLCSRGWQFLIIFCYTELLFPRHFESDRTLISSRTSCLEKSFLVIFRKNSLEDKRSSPKSKQYFRKKMSVMEFVLFSIILRALSASSVFSNIARLLLLWKWRNSLKLTNRKKKR